MRKDLASAIRVLLKLKKEKKVQYAKMIGVSRSALSQFVHQRTTISQEKLLELARILHINEDWISGKDDIFLKSENEVLYFYVKDYQTFFDFASLSYLCKYLFLCDKNICFTEFQNSTYCVLNFEFDISNRVLHDFLKNIATSLSILYWFMYSHESLLLDTYAQKAKAQNLTPQELKKLFVLIMAQQSSFSQWLSPLENELIQYLRTTNIDPRNALDVIKQKFGNA